MVKRKPIKKKEVTKLPKVKKTSAKTSKLTEKKYKVPKERVLSEIQKYWNEVDQYARYLITEQLKRTIPLTTDFKQKLSNNHGYSEVLTDYQENSEELPENPKGLAQEVFYEYLIRVIRYLVQDLTNWPQYDPQHLENLTANEY